MVDPYVAAQLRRLPLFKAYSDADLARLSAFCHVRRLEPGEVVFAQGEVARGMYLVVAGRLVLLQTRPDGSRVQLGTIGPNQFINDAALNVQKIETASFIVVESAIVILVPHDGYQQFLTGAMLPLRREPSINPPVDARRPAPDIPAMQVNAGPQPASHTSAPLPVERIAVANNDSAVPDDPVGAGTALETGVDEKARRFEGQRRDEAVVYMTRRHWWAAFVHIWKPAIMFTLLTVGGVLLDTPILRLAVFALGFVLPGLLMVYYYLEWRNDWLIISNERMLHIRRDILSWSTIITDIPLRAIQGVNAVRPGFMGKILGFGSVDVQLAGEANNLRETIVPRPEDFKTYLFQERSKIAKVVEQNRQQTLINKELDRFFGSAGGPGDPAALVQDGTPLAASKQIPTPNEAHAVSNPPLFAVRFKTPQGDSVYRKHWIVWWRGVMLPATLAFLSVMLLLFGGALLPPEARGISVLIALPSVIIAVGWALLHDWLWRNDYIMVGNNDLTIVKRRPLWLDSLEDHILLDRIDNSVAETGGLMRSLLRYGDVRIFLVGDEKPKIFANMPHPRAMREEISERQSRARKAAADAAELRSVQSALDAVYAYHNRVGAAQASTTPNQPVPPPTNPPFGDRR